jgi:protein-S-isoprenylcysteine O-methyltransferase Ste14
MTPPPFAWPHALIFWLIYVWAFIPEMRILRRARQASARPGSKDSGSLRVMTWTLTTALIVAFPIAFVERWSLPPGMHFGAFIIGILLIVAGSLVRRSCWRTLGEYFTGDIQARAGQPVIRTGPYRLVRHPSYTGGMLMYLGIGLALCSWMSIAALTISGIATYAYRVRVEERILIETIGEPYRIYMRERKRFIPHVV